MKNTNQRLSVLGSSVLTVMAMLLAGSLVGSCGEAKDNFDSRVACNDYCSKKFDCDDHSATDAETNACVSACRDSIEDNCGNEHQAQANDHIAECVDMSCIEFWPCMVFDAAPECYGFISL